MAKIKTFEAACKLLKLDPKKVPVVKGLPAKHQKSIVAYFKLVIIAQALNEGWEPNWSNSDEYKYQPYFWVKADAKHPAGVGFSITGYGVWGSITGVGSRLCFKSSELAMYAGKQFAKLYQEYLLIG
jgi:hypothetical protein